MKTKIAQQENSLYSNYWEVLGPGRISPNASENERKVIGEAKQTFTKYLAAFRKDFESEERRKYAVEKLVEALKNKTFAAGPMTYAGAARIAQDGFYEVMESVKNQVKSELEFGTGEDALDISLDEGGNPWTVADWRNTLGMMLKRAAYQHGEIKVRETTSEQDEKLKKMEIRIKAQYFSMVKALLNRLGKIVNGDNPEKRKLAPNDIVPNAWLSGARGGRGGGPGGRGPGGRRYPGGPGDLDEGFTEQEKEFFNFPFGKKGRGDYLFVHELLRAYGLDTDPRYAVLMENVRELPGRPWRSRQTRTALDSVGGDRGIFYKYVPALNDALNEILRIYSAESKSYTPQQAQLGKQYQASTRHMMERLNMPALKPREEEEVAPYGGTETEPATTTPTGEVDFVTQWKGGVQHEDNFLEKWGSYLERRGFEEYKNAGWLKKEGGRNKIFVRKDTGEILRQTGDGWKTIGHILNRDLEEARPEERAGGGGPSASFEFRT